MCMWFINQWIICTIIRFQTAKYCTINPHFKNCLWKKEVEENPCLENISAGKKPKVSPISFRKMTRYFWDDCQKWQSLTITKNRSIYNVCSTLPKRQSLFPTAGPAVGKTLPFSYQIVWLCNCNQLVTVPLLCNRTSLNPALEQTMSTFPFQTHLKGQAVTMEPYT